MAVGSVVIGESPMVFGTLFEPHVRMAVWTRPNPWKGEVVPAPDVGFTCDGDWIAPDAPVAEWVMEDLLMLGDIFGAMAGERGWRARLETVTNRACPRFHEDATPLRMITTYAGRATEWLFAGESDGDLDARRPSTRRRIRTAAAGAVLMIKGRLMDRFDDRPVVLHRSPAASRKAPRLVCTLDPPFDVAGAGRKGRALGADRAA